MTPDWDIDHIGKALDEDTCELLLNTRWAPKEVKREPGLFHTKWWDYRHENIVRGTYRFAHIFNEETRKIIREHIDNTPPRVTASGKVVTWTPIKEDFLEPPSNAKRLKAWRVKTNCVIRARQFADQCGIPYTFCIRRGLKFHYFGRYNLFEEHKRTLPTPDILLWEECQQVVAGAWLEELNSRICHATHSRFLIKNDVGHHDVARHQTWLIEQIKRKTEPTHALRKFIGNGLLNPEVAERHFDVGLVRSAVAK